ncbi:acyl-CoA N-acyltransferase [Chytriomyces sp. MP71]|nr:acyl-CoA N-acyltransferase [Chytriomyces sp. MP71]
MIQISQVTNEDDVEPIIELYRTSAAYSSSSSYAVALTSSPPNAGSRLPESINFSLTLKHNLTTPCNGGGWIPDLRHVQAAKGRVREGISFKATLSEVDTKTVGLILCSIDAWNGSVKVWDFVVDRTVQRQAIGRRLMQAVIEKAKTLNLRTIVCETQNRNVNALQFYCKMGFRIEAVDTSLYSASDLETQDVALFAKLRLTPEIEGAGTDAGSAVNTLCPNSGKPVSPDSLTFYRGHSVGFCNTHCRDEFANALRVFDSAIADAKK